MKLHNTLTKQIEIFSPQNPERVTMYSCGPTVYDYTHIGHLRTYIYTDVLKRTLQAEGLTVFHVMNITDVGHLSGDDDTGEDKLEKGARKYGKTIEDVVFFFTDFFMASLKKVNIGLPDRFPAATDHIKDMIALNTMLDKKGYAYETKEGLYFDTSKFATYGQLSGQNLSEKMQGTRIDVYVDPDKKHPVDFALWLKRIGRFKDHTLHWDSPWGVGFPGWHIECSAMSMKYLGETLDIHTGGIDHIPVHHENEIAQSEAATGKQFVRFWFHCEFLLIEGSKMSKSLGNLLTIEDIEKRGFEPAALRLLFLQTHYRQKMNFTWEALQAAQTALMRLHEAVRQLRTQTQRTQISTEKAASTAALSKKFYAALSNDLQTPQAIAIIWEIIKSNIPSEDKYDLLLECDRVIGLDINNMAAFIQTAEEAIPPHILQFAEERAAARKNGDFQKADELRKKIAEEGYVIKDTSQAAQGYELEKQNKLIE